MKENSDGNDTNVGSIGNSIEEDIKILESIIKINNDYLKGIENQTINQKEIKAIEHILSDYKRVLKENERYKRSDYETICLENNELREITDRIQSEYNDLLKDNFKLKNELETKRKEYQETYEDIREELGELKKENEELRKENEELKKDYYNVINKIENKIDILDIAISECIYIDDDDKAYKKAVKKDKLCLLNQKRALQELLEEGDLE